MSESREASKAHTPIEAMTEPCTLNEAQRKRASRAKAACCRGPGDCPPTCRKCWSRVVVVLVAAIAAVLLLFVIRAFFLSPPGAAADAAVAPSVVSVPANSGPRYSISGAIASLALIRWARLREKVRVKTC